MKPWNSRETVLKIVDSCLEMERNCTCEVHTRGEALSERQLQNIREIFSDPEGYKLILGIVGTLCAYSMKLTKSHFEFIEGTRATINEISAQDNSEGYGTKN
jgi:hypothetical protein